MKMRAYLALGRVSNLPTVWSNVLTGAWLSGAIPSLAATAALVAALSFFYVGGMFLNDVFDRQADQRLHPDRPIPSGRVSVREASAVGGGLLLLGEAALICAARAAGQTLAPVLASGAALALLIVLYDAWHKGNPFGPLLMGGCRMLVYVTAALAVSGSLSGAVVASGFVLLCYLIGLTYIAKQETLTRFEHGWPLLFLAVPFIYVPIRAAAWSWTGVTLYIFFLGWVVWAVALLRSRRPGNIPRAVVSLIAGISLLDALLLSMAPSAMAALAAFAAFPCTLFLQRYVRGT
jgi:4-hydroxybenzoate polyprenyltransferase